MAVGRGWLVPLFGLFVASFAIGTAELIVTGLLPSLASDLSVDIPTTGLLITGYALGVAIAGPLLALVTGNVPRRALLLVLMAVFVVGNVLCALAGQYWTLMAARLVVAASHGLFFGVGLVVATRLAPAGRQASAVSMLVAGITIANVLGVPLGTAIGNLYGWRVTFGFIAGLGAVAAIILALLVPATPQDKQEKGSFRAELRAVAQPVVLLSYGIITLYMIGVLAVFGYVVPLLIEVTGVPADMVPWVLLAMGIAGFFGNLIGGRLGDWNPSVTTISILVIIIGLWLVMLGIVSNMWLAVPVLCVIWLVGFGFPAPVQSRILKATADAPNFASTLISTAFNIGIAIGAALGGLALSAGWSYGQLPWISVGFMSAALVGTLALTALDRRPVGVVKPA